MSDNETESFQTTEISWSRTLRFWLLIIFDIPSISCSIYVLYHLIINRTLRQALHNHTIIVMLILALVFQLTDIPFYLDFIRKGSVQPPTQAHCLIWWLVDLGFYNTVSIILAWASIERHILIFHGHWVATKIKILFVHYIPLLILLVYATIYYTILIFFPPCMHTFDYTLPVCTATPCHLLDPVLGMWEMGVHGCLSTLIIATFNIALLIRVIKCKRRGRQIFQWRKYRKMISQLLFLAVVYLIFNLPIMVFWVARLCGLPSDVAVDEQLIAFFLTYWVMFLLPVAILFSLSHSKKKLLGIICIEKNQHATVFPMNDPANILPSLLNNAYVTK